MHDKLLVTLDQGFYKAETKHIMINLIENVHCDETK